MLTINENKLSFNQMSEPQPTVEVNLHSFEEEYDLYDHVLIPLLREYANSEKENCITIYIEERVSSNFHEVSESGFITAIGSNDLLEKLYSAFKKINGLQVRYGDHIQMPERYRKYHLQDNQVWQPLDICTWFCKNESYSVVPPENIIPTTPLDEIDFAVFGDETVEPNNKTATPSRYRSARSDAKVGSIRNTIEEIFGLPAGSVQLCGPDGKKLRADASIATLRSRWDA